MAILDELGPSDNGLIYEVDEAGAPRLVRSVRSTHRVFIRFTNVTSRPVKIWWRNFAGRRSFYARLNPTEFCDINTYTNHPWEFTDEETGERFTIGQQVIFRAPERQDNARFRTNWNISLCMRSLRDTALLRLALSIPDPEKVDLLGLPRLLAEDVRKIVQGIAQRKQEQL